MTPDPQTPPILPADASLPETLVCFLELARGVQSGRLVLGDPEQLEGDCAINAVDRAVCTIGFRLCSLVVRQPQLLTVEVLADILTAATAFPASSVFDFRARVPAAAGDYADCCSPVARVICALVAALREAKVPRSDAVHALPSELLSRRLVWMESCRSGGYSQRSATVKDLLQAR